MFASFLAINVLCNVENTNSSVLLSLKIRGRYLKIFRLDKTRAVSVLNSFKNDPLLVFFWFLIQLLIRMTI